MHPIAPPIILPDRCYTASDAYCRHTNWTWAHSVFPFLREHETFWKSITAILSSLTWACMHQMRWRTKFCVFAWKQACLRFRWNSSTMYSFASWARFLPSTIHFIYDRQACIPDSWFLTNFLKPSVLLSRNLPRKTRKRSPISMNSQSLERLSNYAYLANQISDTIQMLSKGYITLIWEIPHYIHSTREGPTTISLS